MLFVNFGPYMKQKLVDNLHSTMDPSQFFTMDLCQFFTEIMFEKKERENIDWMLKLKLLCAEGRTVMILSLQTDGSGQTV